MSACAPYKLRTPRRAHVFRAPGSSRDDPSCPPPLVPRVFLGPGSFHDGPVSPPPLAPLGSPWFPMGSLALVPRLLVLVSRPLGTQWVPSP